MDETYSFKNKELLTITENADSLLYSSASWNYVQSFKRNGLAVRALALGEYNNLWFLLISLLVHNYNSPATLPLI